MAGLYRSVSEKYENSVVKLTSGISEDKVMAELDLYNISINDQLKSEKECYGQVLSMLSAWADIFEIFMVFISGGNENDKMGKQI